MFFFHNFFQIRNIIVFFIEIYMMNYTSLSWIVIVIFPYLDMNLIKISIFV